MRICGRAKLKLGALLRISLFHTEYTPNNRTLTLNPKSKSDPNPKTVARTTTLPQFMWASLLFICFATV